MPESRRLRIYWHTDRKPNDRMLMNNGGDYEEGRQFEEQISGLYLVTYYSSYDGFYCSHCGAYEEHDSADCERQYVSVKQLPLFVRQQVEALRLESPLLSLFFGKPITPKPVPNTVAHRPHSEFDKELEFDE